jgi:hypothetical protein
MLTSAASKLCGSASLVQTFGLIARKEKKKLDATRSVESRSDEN